MEVPKYSETLNDVKKESAIQVDSLHTSTIQSTRDFFLIFRIMSLEFSSSSHQASPPCTGALGEMADVTKPLGRLDGHGK